MEKIGVIAGNRRFPILFTQAAKAHGVSVIAVAIKGDTTPFLKKYVDKIYWLGLREFSRLFDIFKEEGVVKIVMAGQISPYRLFSKEVQEDPLLRELLDGIENKKADTIFGEISRRLEEAGFSVIDSTTYMNAYLPNKGSLTDREPTFKEWEDIYFGFDLAKEIGLLDIGQTVAVKNKSVVAVEALEGTDNLIRRAGSISRGGFTLVKVSKPKQDMRFDVPVVGLNTVRALRAAHASCLAIEAKKTLFIDREASVKLAQKAGIAIVAV